MTDAEHDPDDLLYFAWSIIANANPKDWNAPEEGEKSEWRIAAENWRDDYHEYIGATGANA